MAAAAPATRRPAPRRRTPPRRPPRPAIRVVRRNPGARPAAELGARGLDRLLRGRAWIALIGVLLAGVVFFNVSLLEVNRGITSTSERAAELRRENAVLRLEVARLASSERIQRAAGELGFVLPRPGDVRYLRARPRIDARRAARRIVSPPAVAQQVPAPAPQEQATAAPPPQQAPQAAPPPPTSPAPAAPPPAATAPPTTQTAPPGAGAPTAAAPTENG